MTKCNLKALDQKHNPFRGKVIGNKDEGNASTRHLAGPKLFTRTNLKDIGFFTRTNLKDIGFGCPKILYWTVSKFLWRLLDARLQPI